MPAHEHFQVVRCLRYGNDANLKALLMTIQSKKKNIVFGLLV